MHTRSESRVLPMPRPVVHSARIGDVLLGLLLAGLLLAPVAVTVRWLPYYVSEAAGRVRDPLHPLLRPSGTVGQSFGIAGLAMFLFMWLYPLAKKLSWRWLGSLGAWLRIHIVVGLALPVIVAVHGGWRFRGLIGLGYLSMLLVCLSGVVGRYLYTRIPRRRDGLELSRDEVSGQRRGLATDIAARLGLDPIVIEESLAAAVAPPRSGSLLATLGRMVADDFARARALWALRRAWETPRRGRPALDPKTINEAIKLARREIALAQQLRLLQATHRVFRYWHVAHRPFAITALIAILVHVAVAVAMGQTWLR